MKAKPNFILRLIWVSNIVVVGDVVEGLVDGVRVEVGNFVVVKTWAVIEEVSILNKAWLDGELAAWIKLFWTELDETEGLLNNIVESTRIEPWIKLFIINPLKLEASGVYNKN